eukprot:scaffold11188_cov43-Cyclotella_meneghiniana.AAC.3
MKTLNIMLKIIDVEESNLEPAALVVRMIKYYDEKTCLNELYDRLRETSSYEIEEGNIQIRWGPVSTPSDETMKTVMGTIMAHKTIAESLTDKLIDLNNTPHQEIYPHTGMWIFYRGKEDDMSLNTMKDGIRAQRDYMEQTETITVGGLGNYRLDEIRPAMKINRQGNSANHTAAQLIVLEDIITKDGKFEASPFDGVYRKPNGNYVFTGNRRNTTKMREYFREGTFLSSITFWGYRNLRGFTVKALWRKLPENEDQTTEFTIVDPVNLKDPINKESQQIRNTEVNSEPVEGIKEVTNKPTVPEGNPPPIQLQEIYQKPPQYEQFRGYNGFPTPHYYEMRHNPYYDPLNDKTQSELNRWSMAPSKNIEIPKFPGSISHESLEFITNSILEQFRVYIPKITEEAWSVCDPAARLVSLLLHRDKALLSCINDTLDANMRHIIGEIYNQDESEDTAQINNTHAKEHQTPMQTGKSTGGILDSASDGGFYTPGGEASQSKVNSSLKRMEKETSAIMEKERLKFEAFSDELNVSNISKDETICSPNTEKLKKELANESTLSSWSQGMPDEDLISKEAIDEHLKDLTEETEPNIVATPSKVSQQIDSKGSEANMGEKPKEKTNSETDNSSKESTSSMEKNERKEKAEEKDIQTATSGDSSVSSGLPEGINGENNGTAKKETKQTIRETPSRRCKITKKPSSNNTATGRDAT